MRTLSELMSVLDKVNQVTGTEEIYRNFNKDEVETLITITKEDTALVKDIPETDFTSYCDSKNQPIPGKSIDEQRESLRQIIDNTREHLISLFGPSVTPSEVGQVRPGMLGVLFELAEEVNRLARRQS